MFVRMFIDYENYFKLNITIAVQLVESCAAIAL